MFCFRRRNFCELILHTTTTKNGSEVRSDTCGSSISDCKRAQASIALNNH